MFENFGSICSDFSLAFSGNFECARFPRTAKKRLTGKAAIKK